MKFVCLTCKKVSCYEISFCETRKKRFSLQNIVAKLASRNSHNSHNKISVCETREKRVSLLILTSESPENLTRILGLESESCFSREFQKMILVSTLIVREAESPNQTIMRMLGIGLIRNGVFNFSRNTIIASCWMWLSWLSQLFAFIATYFALAIIPVLHKYPPPPGDWTLVPHDGKQTGEPEVG